jgi:hypothetical protein
MIRVTLETPPLEGARLDLETVSTLEIREMAGATQAFSTYNWMLRSTTGTVLYAGNIHDYPRAAGGWALVGRVLHELAEQELR